MKTPRNLLTPASGLAIGAVLALSVVTIGTPASASAAVQPRIAVSSFEAGYVANPTTVASVSTTFKVPQVTCHKTGDDVVLLGVGDFTDFPYPNDLATVDITCSDSTEYIDGYTYVDGAAFAEGVNPSPGDTMHASWTQGNGMSVAAITDVTNGESYTQTGTNEGETSVQVGSFSGEDASELLPPKFDPVKFTNVVLNGLPWADTPSTAQKLNTDGTVNIVPSALSTLPAKTSFSLTWKSSK